MPFKTGIEIVKEIQAYIKKLNEKVYTVEEPLFMFLSAHVGDENF